MPRKKLAKIKDGKKNFYYGLEDRLFTCIEQVLGEAYKEEAETELSVHDYLFSTLLGELAKELAHSYKLYGGYKKCACKYHQKGKKNAKK